MRRYESHSRVSDAANGSKWREEEGLATQGTV